MAFSPSDIAGLACWYQAADLLNGGSLPADGTAVSTWKDKSGNARDLSQATGSLQPVFKAAGFHGKQAVLFSGSSSAQQNLISGTLNLAQPGTVFVACQFGSPLTTAQYLLDGATNRWLCNNENPGSATKLAAYAGAGPVDFTVANNVLLSPSVIALQYNGASGLGRLNGAALGTGNVGTSTLDVLSLGGRNGLGGLGFNGPIAEVIIYTAALSAQDMQRVETYLAYTYNLSLQEVWTPVFTGAIQH